MQMSTYVVRCTHCGRNVRVESTVYQNTCPVCSNVLPPQFNRFRPRPGTVFSPAGKGKADPSVDANNKTVGGPADPVQEDESEKPENLPPIVPASVVEDDGQGVDVGDIGDAPDPGDDI